MQSTIPMPQGCKGSIDLFYIMEEEIQCTACILWVWYKMLQAQDQKCFSSHMHVPYMHLKAFVTILDNLDCS